MFRRYERQSASSENDALTTEVERQAKLNNETLKHIHGIIAENAQTSRAVRTPNGSVVSSERKLVGTALPEWEVVLFKDDNTQGVAFVQHEFTNDGIKQRSFSFSDAAGRPTNYAGLRYVDNDGEIIKDCGYKSFTGNDASKVNNLVREAAVPLERQPQDQIDNNTFSTIARAVSTGSVEGLLLTSADGTALFSKEFIEGTSVSEWHLYYSLAGAKPYAALSCKRMNNFTGNIDEMRYFFEMPKKGPVTGWITKRELDADNNVLHTGPDEELTRYESAEANRRLHLLLKPKTPEKD